MAAGDGQAALQAGSAPAEAKAAGDSEPRKPAAAADGAACRLPLSPLANGCHAESQRCGEDMLADSQPNGLHVAAASPEDASSPDSAAMSPASLQEKSAFIHQELSAIRHRHHARYQEREQEAAESAQKEQELQDFRIAEEVAKEDEEARRRQLEADEELSRQLAEQLNPRGSVHPLQTFSRGGVENIPLDDGSDIDDQYHQMEDGDGVRRPMRTGYLEQLIQDPAPIDFRQLAGDFRQVSPFPPLLAGFEEGDAREVYDFEPGAGCGRPCGTLVVPIVLTTLIAATASYFVFWLFGK